MTQDKRESLWTVPPKNARRHHKKRRRFCASRRYKLVSCSDALKVVEQFIV